MKRLPLIIVALILAAGCGGQSKTQQMHNKLEKLAKTQCQVDNALNGTHKSC